jgi:hypothetical protein
MNRLLQTSALALSLLLLSVAMPAQAPPPDAPKPEVDLSTPEAAVKSFFAAFSAADLKRLTACVEGATFTADSATLEGYMKRSQERVSLTPTAFHLETKDNSSTGTVELTVQMIPGSNSPTLKDASETAPHSGVSDSITLHKVGERWFVVPPNIRDFKFEMLMQSGVIAGTTAAALPQILVGSRDAAAGANCVSRMKRLSVALLEYTLDHNDRFTLKTETLHGALLPYVTKFEKTLLKSPRGIYADTERNLKLLSEKPFRCPREETGEPACRFNKNLEGVNSLQIPDARQALLIALYEGSDQKLSFRHRGKAVVGLASGKVRSVTPEEAKTLLWKP